MSARDITRGTWMVGRYGTSDGPITAQLPSSSGTSIAFPADLVEPLRPEWPSWRQIFAGVLAWTKSMMRRHAGDVLARIHAGAAGVMRPSGETQAISVNTSPAPPMRARAEVDEMEVVRRPVGALNTSPSARR